MLTFCDNTNFHPYRAFVTNTVMLDFVHIDQSLPLPILKYHDCIIALYSRREQALLEEILGPDDAVNGLRWRVSDGASWESLLGRLRLTLVALRQSLKSNKRTITVE